jgi:hypothetical protein
MIKKLYYKLITEDPYQDVNDNHRTIFIHIPKNAGTSIEEALFNTKIGHKTCKQFQAHNSKKFKSYWKFAIVRNPYDRLVSAFHFLKKGGFHEPDRIWSKKNIGHIDDFEHFIDSLKDKKFATKIMRWQHFQPQSFYLENLSNIIDVDHIGRFENLDNEFDLIKKHLNLNNKQIKHNNRSIRGDYGSYYKNNEMKNVVQILYKKDFKNFGYKE